MKGAQTMSFKFFAAALSQIEEDARRGNVPWLLRLAERWPYWWEEQSGPHQPELAAVEQESKQREFIAEVRRYAGGKWLKHPRAADWILFSLATVEPFNRWSDMRDCKDRTLKKVSGIYGIVVPRSGEASPENVVRWIACLLPKSEGDSTKTDAHPLDFTLSDGGAKSAPSDSIEGLRRTLDHLSARRFWAWLLRDGLIETRLERSIETGLFVVCLLLLSALYTAPARPYLEDESLIVPWAAAFIASASAALLFLLWTSWRKYRSARRDMRVWMDLLQNSDVGIALDSDRHLIVEGASFGMALSLSVLLALDDVRPAESGFWRRAINSLRSVAETSVFTGRVRGDGSIGDVEDIPRKMEAARLHNRITNFVMPVQPVDAVTPDRRGDQASTAATPRANDNSHTPLCADARVVGASSRNGLTVLPVDRLTRLLSDRKPVRRRLAGVLPTVASLCLAGLAGRACFDVFYLLDSSPPPKVLLTSINIRNSGLQADLPLEVASDVPEQFAAAVVSHYWMSTTAHKLIRGGPKMFKLRRVSSPQYGSFDGLVEVYRLRRLLWRELPSKRIRSAALKEITVQQ
jgi:hypothetical protein